MTTSSFPNRPWKSGPSGPGAGRPGPARPGAAGGGAFIPTVIVLAALLFLFVLLANVWTDVLWYDQLNALRVFWTQWGAEVIVGAASALVLAIVIAVNMKIAYPKDGIPEPTALRNRSMDAYRKAIGAHKKLVFIGLPIIIGILFGAGVGTQWRTIMLFLNGSKFGTTDPEFGLDVGFFVFTLPALALALSYIVRLLVASWFTAGIMHYLYGGIDPTQKPMHVSKPARIHLGVLGALSAFTAAVWFWLSRYELLVGNNPKFSGASYTDIKASLPAREIMAGICLIIVALFIYVAVTGKWRIAFTGIGVAVLAQLVVGLAYPALVQQFKVQPNAVELESPYIQRNIDATLHAYGLDDIDETTYNAKTEATKGQLREDTESTAQIRLLDPNQVSPTFNQLQQNRQYYGFPDQLAVDKYKIGDELRDTVIAVRELNLRGLGADQRTWVNDHTVYTHGYGVVTAYGNTAQTDGRPAFYEQGIPSTGELGDYEPRVYFGQSVPEYSIVGAPEGTTPWELDYPNDDAPNGQVNTTYEGDGGPKISNFWIKLLYATKFRDLEIFFSDRVNDQSQVLYDRDPHDRVEKVAPYLTLDSKAYPAVVDMDGDPDTPKDLVWIIDGYTTSNEYPYSARESLEAATRDTQETTLVGFAPAEVNYIRNSVKAVVNAYDGSVTLYGWDDSDPILKAWSDIFPGQIKPVSEMSGDLMSHVRYPEDLFKVQRQLLTRYHVTDAASFYSGGDFWNVPPDPTLMDTQAQTPQPPFYQTLQMPGSDGAKFSLSSSFIPGGNTDRNVLTGFLAVNADAGDKPGEPDPDYGKLRLLELPRDLTVPGPGQVQNNFNSNAEVSRVLNLLRQGGSKVISGNLLTLPMGGGLIYIQPVYVQSAQGTSYPLLQYVLVAFGDQVGFAPTLDEALDQVFGGDSGAQAGDSDVDAAEREEAGEAIVEGEDPAEGEPSEEPSEKPSEEPSAPAAPPAGSPQDRLSQALDDASKALKDSHTAMENGDWAAYGKAQDELDKALEQAIKAQEEIED